MGSKKIHPPTSKKKDVFSKKNFFKSGFRPQNFSFEKKSFHANLKKCELELCISNGSKVLIYLSFLLFLKEACA
jgi:hypothetical protein